MSVRLRMTVEARAGSSPSGSGGLVGLASAAPLVRPGFGETLDHGAAMCLNGRIFRVADATSGGSSARHRHRLRGWLGRPRAGGTALGSRRPIALRHVGAKSRPGSASGWVGRQEAVLGNVVCERSGQRCRHRDAVRPARFFARHRSGPAARQAQRDPRPASGPRIAVETSTRCFESFGREAQLG
jgi:hypothetical protein